MRVKLCSLLILCVSGVGQNFDLIAGGFGFYVSGGYSFPASPMRFAEYWEAGFNFGGGIEVSPTATISISASFDCSEFGLKKDKYKKSHRDIPAGTTLQGGSIQIINGCIRIKASPLMPVPFRPYFIGEIGGIRKKGSDITYVWESETKIVKKGDLEIVPSIVAFGMGVDFVYPQVFNVFVEVGYRVGFTTIDGWTGYAPLKMGIKLIL